jgi:hypothetical protein
MKFAKFALPAALAFAAIGAQATELYTPNAVQGASNATSIASSPANPADVFAPSAVNRFERGTAEVTRTSVTTPRDVYAPSLVNQAARMPADTSTRPARSAVEAPMNADAGRSSTAGQRDIYTGA